MGLLPFEKEKDEIVERYKSITNINYGKEPNKRTIKELIDYGFINLDKPSGPTSHEVADFTKKILKLNAAGHGGTLDPRVTGVLPIGLNKATRILEVFLLGGKEYVCEMSVHSEVSKKVLMEAFAKFTGVIRQLPPIKSNVKRQWRNREIYYIDVLEIYPRKVLFKVGCEAGTYIRKLCTDLGEYMGTKAHMQDLRRTKASCFNEENSHSLHELQEAKKLYDEKGDESLLRQIILPVEAAVGHLKKIIISDGATPALLNGSPLMLPGLVKLSKNIKKDDVLAIFTLKNELVGLGIALMTTEEMIKESKGICVKLKKIIMPMETYKRE
ncbi:MAG: RNA-guided pseudouridylation complex pseudouridine synthase subunit Cbf5 [Candidatus Nanoarchaeia archaeon]|nr:RNA-guided pseudouridylation complex pseudouridine synthase subunit Cbf5 [Candidatus Nanoarchaeia archaeon]